MNTAARAKAWTKSDVEAGVGRPLQPYDWINAALNLLISQGVHAVRITLLAESLGVSRGSFYWHFRGRDALLDVLIDYWRDKNTAAVVAAMNEARVLADGILNLFAVWIHFELFDPKLDSAMRDWGRQSRKVRRAVEAADEERLSAIAALFERNGFSRKLATVRARVLYFTQVGYYAMSIEETLVERMGNLEAYYEAFTGRKLNPALAKACRDRHLR
ncbi:MAG: TetR/AcrR family transcriptional regulator [Gammaproteobacteria bacterium]|nr:TetR/AcrR family transcriptional regulator [Gammaproteobacteria bacterium]